VYVRLFLKLPAVSEINKEIFVHVVSSFGTFVVFMLDGILFYFAILDCGARCWWRIWLRHCATSRKVAGSIPDGVVGIFY
jgi:hypothetical protein